MSYEPVYHAQAIGRVKSELFLYILKFCLFLQNKVWGVFNYTFLLGLVGYEMIYNQRGPYAIVLVVEKIGLTYQFELTLEIMWSPVLIASSQTN